MSTGRDRYFERYREDQNADRLRSVVIRKLSVRFVLVAAMYVPMTAVALLPVTALAGLAASGVAGALGSGVGAAVLVSIVAVLGTWVATIAFANGSRPVSRGWRRAMPHLVTVAVIASGLTEIVSGSRAPDPLLALWFVSVAWLFVFAAHVRARWSVGRRVLWASGPLVTIVVIVFVWTSGFFAWRFDRSVADLDAFVERLDAGDRFVRNTDVGWFTIRSRGRLRGCDRAFRITGWHEADDRWIAFCPAGPPGRPDVDHLAGSWYEYPG